MKNKALTLTVVASMTSNYGEGLGNVGSIQKVYKNGKAYAIRSRESMKNAIMVQSGLYDDLKVEQDGKVDQKAVSKDINVANNRALEGGYMSTIGDRKIRRSSFYLTDAISFYPFVNETRFHNNLYLAQTFAKENGINIQEKAANAGLMPYQYEYDKSLKRYSITIDLDKVGIDENYDTVLIHDAARPFVSVEMIEEAIQEALIHKSYIPGVALKDTVKQISEDSFVENTPDRAKLVAVQTPQAFDFNLCKKAYEILSASDKLNKIPTDDEMLVYELMGVHAKVGTGSIYNIKITTREDMYMAERIADILGLT